MDVTPFGHARGVDLFDSLTPRERRLLTPRVIAGQVFRPELEAMQQRALERLRAVDDELEQLLQERLELVTMLRAIRDGMGTGNRHVPRAPWPAEVDAVPEGTVEIRGTELRAALRAVLGGSDEPMRIDELHRGLLVRGLRPPDPVSKSISDALRAELARGRVQRPGRGEYVRAA